MGFRSRIAVKLAGKAQQLAVEHKDDIKKGLLKAGAAADQRTGGRHHEKLRKAAEVAAGYVEKLPEPNAGAPARREPPHDPPRSGDSERPR